MVNPSNCYYFIDEILAISTGLAQHLHFCKTSTTKLPFVDRSIASLTQLVLKAIGYFLNFWVKSILLVWSYSDVAEILRYSDTLMYASFAMCKSKKQTQMYRKKFPFQQLVPLCSKTIREMISVAVDIFYHLEIMRSKEFMHSNIKILSSYQWVSLWTNVLLHEQENN